MPGLPFSVRISVVNSWRGLECFSLALYPQCENQGVWKDEIPEIPIHATFYVN